KSTTECPSPSWPPMTEAGPAHRLTCRRAGGADSRTPAVLPEAEQVGFLDVEPSVGVLARPVRMGGGGKRMAVTTFKADRTLLARLAAAASRAGLSQGAVIREALGRELAFREAS